jgi:hypothetical protein
MDMGCQYLHNLRAGGDDVQGQLLGQLGIEEGALDGGDGRYLQGHMQGGAEPHQQAHSDTKTKHHT